MVEVLHLEHGSVCGAEIGTFQKIDQKYLESS
jgi:hypothetical protein